jgi:HSP20 family protein
MTTQRQGFSPLWDQLNLLQNEMNRAIDRWSGGALTRAGMSAYPPVNLWEEEDKLCIESELSGVEIQDLDISVTGGNELVIKGERKPMVPPKAVWHRRERRSGAFQRTLPLPYLVDPDKVEATLDHGVLLIKLGKHVSAQPRKIQVKGS